MVETSVAIVTDSTSDLSTEICDAHNVTMVPLTLTIGAESMPDRTIGMPEFFDRMNAAAELPTTSQPSIGAFTDAYRHLLQTASDVVSVHISSKLSGTMASALAAAEEFAGRVHVVDSLNLSWGLGFQVLEGARAAATGLTAGQVVERVERVRDRAQLIIGVDSLENLVKGGRLPRAVGAVGGMLNVKITIAVKDGALSMVRPVRGSRAAMEFGLRWAEERMAGMKRGAFCAMHAMAEDSAEWLRDQIGQRFEPTELYVAETGTVVAAHTGSGWGIAFVPEE